MRIDERDNYFKLVAAVETDYNVDVYTLRISLDMMPPDLNIRDKVLFTGRYWKREGIEQFHLQSITVPLAHGKKTGEKKPVKNRVA